VSPFLTALLSVLGSLLLFVLGIYISIPIKYAKDDEGAALATKKVNQTFLRWLGRLALLLNFVMLGVNVMSPTPATGVQILVIAFQCVTLFFMLVIVPLLHRIIDLIGSTINATMEATMKNLGLTGRLVDLMSEKSRGPE
jgi:hypothetical protein